MLVTHNRVEMEVPHEPGQRITFRPLSGDELDEAESNATRRALEMTKGIDLSAITATREVPEAEARRARYDAKTVVRYGIIEWTYQAECNDETKGELDAKTRDWARDVILGMSTRTEEERGNSAASSSEGESLPSSGELTSYEPEASASA